jgi:tRNA pseudouridine32 synthase/23S rRNA pseudouridine746 synthase
MVGVMPPWRELYRDNRFVVIDKPAGLPVHAGPRGGASVEDYFPLLTRRREGPWLAHRLDADTSGCLVIALRHRALVEAQAAFAEGRADKTYWAIVEGLPQTEAGIIDLPLRKLSGAGAGWRMVAGQGGDRAVTEWHVLARAEGMAWLALHPRTGRTHQIRAHCAAMGWPLAGDQIYGAGPGPLQLLARRIALPLDTRLEATAPPPAHMEALLSKHWAASHRSHDSG